MFKSNLAHNTTSSKATVPQTIKHLKISLEEHLNTGRNNNLAPNAPQTATHKYTKNPYESLANISNNPNLKSGLKNRDQVEREREREQQTGSRETSKPRSSSGLSVVKTQIPLYYMSGLEKHHKVEDTNDYFCKLYRDHFIQSVQAMQFCRNLKPVDQAELAKKKVYLIN